MSITINTAFARTLAIIGTILAVTFAAIVGMGTGAHAHNTLVSSTPAEGSVLTELPAEFDVTTNAPLLETGAAALQVTDAAGLFYGDGCITVAGPSVRMVPELGAAGAYTLTWQAVSEDGHTISGVIPFTWEPAAETEGAAGSATAPVCGEATVEPSATPSEEPAASPSPSASEDVAAEPENPQTGIDAVIPWIIGGAIVLVVATGVVLLLTRRKDKD
jgi:methionine-rich copper-binding protein CopC